MVVGGRESFNPLSCFVPGSVVTVMPSLGLVLPLNSGVRRLEIMRILKLSNKIVRKAKLLVLILFLSGVIYYGYILGGAFVLAMGIGNERHFNSLSFQLERARKLGKLSGKGDAPSLQEATLQLLPAEAQNPVWSYNTGDDSWLCSVTSLHWLQEGKQHDANWVLIYGLDWRWREHFVEAAALNDEAKSITPMLERRDSIYGSPTHYSMLRCPECTWY